MSFRAMWNWCRTGQRVDAEAVRQRKDGSRLHVLVVSVPVSVPGGQIAVYAMYSDITERKAAEIALQALSSRLLEVQETERQAPGPRAS